MIWCKCFDKLRSMANSFGSDAMRRDSLLPDAASDPEMLMAASSASEIQEKITVLEQVADSCESYLVPFKLRSIPPELGGLLDDCVRRYNSRKEAMRNSVDNSVQELLSSAIEAITALSLPRLAQTTKHLSKPDLKVIAGTLNGVQVTEYTNCRKAVEPRVQIWESLHEEDVALVTASKAVSFDAAKEMFVKIGTVRQTRVALSILHGMVEPRGGELKDKWHSLFSMGSIKQTRLYDLPARPDSTT